MSDMFDAKDMPKLESPFVRKEIDGKYVVTPEITEGYEWVFEGKEDEVICMEKLDGTNVSVIIRNKEIIEIYNRKNKIEFFDKNKRYIIEGLLESNERGYLDLSDGQHFGELIGEKVNGNPLQIKGNLWLPFNTYCMNHIAYNSWHKYPKTYENIKNWFFKSIDEGGIFSLYARKHALKIKPEGVVFYNLKTGQLAKLRLDMFPEWTGDRHKQYE